MRQSLAGISNCPTALSVALLAVVMAPSSPDVALSDASGSGALSSAAPPTPACGSNELEVHEPLPDSEPGCATAQRIPAEIAEARAYLVETASPGYTMTLQGAELAIGRLHPEFAVRLENAIREARSAGLPSAGVFSAYRPPAFGVGGFSDKFNSLHTYGLAVDMRCQERRRLSLWSSRPRRMESLPADQRQDHLSPEPLARDGELGGSIRS
jgi:hypothetical protein